MLKVFNNNTFNYVMIYYLEDILIGVNINFSIQNKWIVKTFNNKVHNVDLKKKSKLLIFLKL